MFFIFFIRLQKSMEINDVKLRNLIMINLSDLEHLQHKD